MKNKRTGLATALLVAAGLVVFAQDAQRNFPPDFMGVTGITGWVLSGNPRTFSRDGLYGYVDGGAEVFLQYGFRDLTVFSLIPDKAADPKKAVTLEIYRMDSPKDAFGIFSTRREGGEAVSPGIKTFHWLGREQASLVKGNLFVNILAAGCTQAEVGDFLASLTVNLPAGETPMPEAFSCLPEFNLIPGTERFICGDVAATNESPLLGAEFWGFREGLTEAYSAKYGPGTGKLVLIKFREPPQDLPGKVYRLFKDHAMDVRISRAIMQGVTVVGRNFYFGQSGPNGVIVIDELDPNVARAYIQEALDKTAKKMNESEKDKKKDDKK
ncbi:MAG: DUF6599 family protein [Candidatus Aminicenantales bacterium]